MPTSRWEYHSKTSRSSWTASDAGGIADGSVVLDLAAGDYTLTLETGTVTGDYSFRLLDLSSATALNTGAATNGTLDAATTTHVYSFTAAASDRFLWNVSTYDGPSGGHWRLLDPSADVVAGGSLGGAQTAVDLTASGSYTLLVEGDIADTFSIVITVTDLAGNVAALGYDVSVEAPPANSDPEIISVPHATVQAGQTFSHQLIAVDPDGDPLTYSLISGPMSSNMMTVSSSGLITWNPDSNDINTPGTPHEYTVKVEDGQGGSHQLTFDLDVVSSAINTPPAITSTPTLSVTAGANYAYVFSASDPDMGDTLTWSIITAPTGMDFDNSQDPTQLEWTPGGGDVGTHTVTLRVTDSASNYNEQSFTLAVRAANVAPTLTAATLTAVADRAYLFQFQAGDTDGDPLSFTLDSGPSGAAVSPTGVFSWSPVAADVNDPGTPYQVTVTADTTAPTVDLFVSQDPATVGTDLIVRPHVFDDVDDNPVIIITINGTEVPVGDDGTVYVPVNDTTTINIVVDVTDEAGNTTQVTRQITAIDTSDVNAPVVSLITPDDDALLTAPTEVTGTVDDPDDNLTSWTLTAIHLQTGAATQLGSGSSEVTAGTLGTLDTNELINGAYRLEIVATDSGGHTSITHRHVVIDSNLKPGNFSISFVDLQVPVAGLPITLTRSYSSMRANTSDDFGYGWQLDITNTAVDVISIDDSTPSGYGEYIPFRNGDRVIVTLPDGSTEGFTFLPEPDVVVYGNVVNWKPAFIADPGVSSQLTVKTDGISIRKQGDEYVSAASGSGYHPGLAEFGGTYTLVTRSGVELVLDATTGDLEQIVDRNDNTLYYDEHGIQSSAGRGVVFERDFDDRITRVTDPGGFSMHYAYNSDGDLISFTDRAGAVTQFTYHDGTSAPLHYLDDIIDPLGRTAAQTTYNSEGRVESITDADGQTINYTYNAGTKTQTTTDQLGYSTTITFDDNGNIVREVNHLGGITTRAYDSRDNLIGETSVVGLEDAASAETDDLTYTYTYDSNDHLIAQTSTDGNTTYYSYNSYGQLLTATDPLGNTTKNYYDERGNLSDVTDPLGKTTHFYYDNRGNVTLVSDLSNPSGDATVLGHNSYGDLLWIHSNVTYSGDNLFDEPIVTTNPNSKQTNFTYDDLGQQTGTSFTWTDPNDSNNTSTITTSTTYDYNGRAISHTDANGHTTNTVYDFAGQVTSTTDVYDNTTTTLYDPRGQAIQTTYGDGTISRTVYDAKGRALYTTDSHLPANDAQGTYYIYDALDRAVETRRYNDVVISITTVSGTSTSDLISIGTLLSSNTSTYDDVSGRLLSSTSSTGLVTTYEYDDFGRQAAMETTDGNTTRRTEYTYDQYGRQIAVEDALGHFTYSSYDALGRLDKTTYHDGSTTSSTYDSYGRVVTQTDQMGLVKTFEYDEFGRLTAVVLPEVVNPDTSQLENPRYEYEYDVYGNQKLIRDPLDRETLFAYDEFGRQTSRELPLGQTETFEYDDYGRQSLHTSFEGNLTERVYTDFGFLDELRYYTPGSDPENDPADEVVAFLYNSENQRTQVADERGDTDFAYDDFGRLAQIDSPEGILNYEYDDLGRKTRTSVGDPQDPTHDWTYDYDDWGRLETVTTVERNDVVLSTPEVTTYTYDVLGNLVRVDHSNGSIATYTYDDLYRLDVLTYYAPDGTPNDLTNNDKLYEFDYSVRADGKRTGVSETRWDGSTSYVSTFAWTYDDLGRLTEEAFDSHDNNLDYTNSYTYNLVGSRIGKEIDQGSDSSVDESYTYAYDDNDRLITETKVVGAVDDGTNMETDDRTTTYTYNNTQQITKTEKETYSQNNVQAVSYDYNLQGRLSEVVIDTYDANGDVIKKETTTFVYDENGIRRSSTHKIEEDTDSNPATALVTTLDEETDYLVDAMNATGYAQVIEQITRDASTQAVTDAKVFTLGHDVIDQTMFTPGGAAGNPLTLLYDGHGSTRALLDYAAAITEHYTYTAYGLPIGFDQATALTALLYSGEWFDSRIDLQYLRARPYNPNIAGFLRLDDFAGNRQDPQSLHKYLYTHGDPVNGIDPSGEAAFAVSLGVGFANLLAALPISLHLRQVNWEYVGLGAATAIGGIAAIEITRIAISIYGDALANGGLAIADEATRYLTLMMTNARVISKALALEAAQRQRNRRVQVFPVFRAMWPEIYAWRTGPDGVTLPRSLTYAGPISAPGMRTFRRLNRNRAKTRFILEKGKVIRPPGTSFDEYPYASTREGGANAFGAYVSRTENYSEGGMLAAFYRVALRNIPLSPFVVVDIP